MNGASGDPGIWIGVSAGMLSAVLGAIWIELRALNVLLRDRTHWLRNRMQWVIGCVELIAAQAGVRIPEPPDGDWR